jgi:hypothetical protein
LKRRTILSEDEQNQKKKKYEENRPDRKFNKNWKEGRQWFIPCNRACSKNINHGTVMEHVGHMVRKKIVVCRSDNNFTCQNRRTDDIWERLEYMFLFQILQWFLDGINKNDRVGVKTWVCRETWNANI